MPEVWTYWKGSMPDGVPPAVFRRAKNGETDRWDGPTQDWVKVPGDSLTRAMYSGDWTYWPIDETEAQRLMAAH